MRRHFGIPWSINELRVADRHVRALMNGEYPTAEAALPDCRKALARLRDADRRVPVRTRRAVLSVLIERAHAAGRPRRRVRPVPAERRLFDRYARLLVEGRFTHVADAARACWAEHKRLHRRGGEGWRGAVPRSLNGVYQQVEVRARKLGRAPGVNAWTQAELRVINRFARGVVVGKYHDAKAAVPACRAELARQGLAGRHTEHSTAARLRGHAHALGWSAQFTVWSADENAVADRFARAVVRGRYPRATAATADCLQALRDAGLPGRSSPEVRSKLIKRTLQLGRKQNYVGWSRDELGILDRCARGLVDGRYPSAEQAVGPCRRALVTAGFPERPRHGIRHKLLKRAHVLGRPRRDWCWTDEELRRLDAVAHDYAAGKYPNVASAGTAGLRALGRFHPKGRRTSSGAQRVILQLARAYGREQSWRLWTEAENKVCDSWIRWYERHRHVRRYKPAKEAVRGLQEELQNMGSERTLGGCNTYFYNRRLRLLGVA